MSANMHFAHQVANPITQLTLRMTADTLTAAEMRSLAEELQQVVSLAYNISQQRNTLINLSDEQLVQV